MNPNTTIVISNGSKWAGQEPDTIRKLLEVLHENTIEERFFEAYKYKNDEGIVVWENHCPIRLVTKKDMFTQNDKENFVSDYTIFFGNFEELSHVFRIETNYPLLVEALTSAIKANKGWKKYYKRHLRK